MTIYPPHQKMSLDRAACAFFNEPYTKSNASKNLQKIKEFDEDVRLCYDVKRPGGVMLLHKYLVHGNPHIYKMFEPGEEEK